MSSGGQLVVFGLNNQKYALPIDHVSEIIRMVNVTEIPNTRSFCKGIINLRGSVVAVISLGLRLGIEDSEINKDTLIIVAEAEGKKLGLVVDNVYSVTRYDGDEVENLDVENEFVDGVVHRDRDTILLLNLGQIMQ